MKMWEKFVRHEGCFVLFLNISLFPPRFIPILCFHDVVLGW
jgi:hypothetical protein